MVHECPYVHVSFKMSKITLLQEEMALSQSSEGDSERFTPPRVGIPRDLQSCGEFLPGQSGMDQAPTFEPALVVPCVFELQGSKNMCGGRLLTCSLCIFILKCRTSTREGMAGIGVKNTFSEDQQKTFVSIKNKLKPQEQKERRKEGKQSRNDY